MQTTDGLIPLSNWFSAAADCNGEIFNGISVLMFTCCEQSAGSSCRVVVLADDSQSVL